VKLTNEFMVGNVLSIGQASSRLAGEFIFGLTGMLLAIDSILQKQAATPVILAVALPDVEAEIIDDPGSFRSYMHKALLLSG
jgi:hypothetical protein